MSSVTMSLCLVFSCSLLLAAPVSSMSVEDRRELNLTRTVTGGDTELTFHPDNSLNEMWSTYKTQYSKSYSTLREELSRKLIFVDNLEYIWKHNDQFARGLKSYSLGVNQFTDLSSEEFVSRMNGLKRRFNETSTSGATYMSPNVKYTLPESVDWRNQGYVTPVKDQGSCGSCWLFSTTGTLEGQHFRSTGSLVSLSEQNLVDCASNHGCDGGYEEYAYEYIIENGGIDTEQSYKYTAVGGKCAFNPQTVGATMTTYTLIKPSGNEQKLQEAVANVGPISVNIDASHSSFKSYQSGVYDEGDCSSSSLDHAVLVVGYGTSNNHDYWIVKNSWGERWGDQGYIYMSRNRGNQCGIATHATYPII